MSLTLNPGAVKVLQWPMPVKANFVELSLNGEKVRGALTAGRGKTYTYFETKGASFYVPGHLDTAVDYTVDFPEGYTPKVLKVTRAVVKKAKVAKAEATPADGEAVVPASSAPATDASAPPAPFGKKAQRK